MGHPIYHLDLQVARCRAEVRLNDMPAAELESRDEVPVTFAPPLNPYLVGDLNVIDVTLFPVASEDGRVSSFWDAEIAAWVRRYEKGDIVAPGEGPVVAEIEIPDELRERVKEEELELPLSFSHVFSNEVVDFSAELSGAPPFDDPEGLRDYAIRLRDLVAAKDVTGLMAEFEPKIEAWAAAYDEPVDQMREALREDLGEFVNEDPIVDFGRDDVDLTRYAGGRIWELRRWGGLPLLQTEEQPDGSRSQYPTFAGRRTDGRLCVIR